MPSQPTLQDVEEYEAKDDLCGARSDIDKYFRNSPRRALNEMLKEAAGGLNVSTSYVLEIMKNAIHDAKAKNADITWAEFCAPSIHNDDRSPLDLSVFEHGR